MSTSAPLFNEVRLIRNSLFTDKENTADAHEISEQMTVKHGIDIGLYYAANGFVFTCKQIDLDEHKTLPKMFTNVVCFPFLLLYLSVHSCILSGIDEEGQEPSL